MIDFSRKTVNGIRIETVNLPRATYKEASAFKDILNEDVELRLKKLIIDISQCKFIDSTFLGVLVVTLKNMSRLEGEIHLVKPPAIVSEMMDIVWTLRIFKTYETLDEAINSFNN